MVDVTEDFLIKAKTYLGEEGKRVRNYFCCGLQDFSPEPNSYDVIWIQWVIGELLAALSTSHTPPAAEVGPPPTRPEALGAPAAGGAAGISPVLPGSARTVGNIPCKYPFRVVSVPVTGPIWGQFCVEKTSMSKNLGTLKKVEMSFCKFF